jgi:hypothetical protein
VSKESANRAAQLQFQGEHPKHLEHPFEHSRTFPNNPEHSRTFPNNPEHPEQSRTFRTLPSRSHSPRIPYSLLSLSHSRPSLGGPTRLQRRGGCNRPSVARLVPRRSHSPVARTILSLHLVLYLTPSLRESSVVDSRHFPRLFFSHLCSHLTCTRCLSFSSFAFRNATRSSLVAFTRRSDVLCSQCALRECTYLASARMLHCAHTLFLVHRSSRSLAVPDTRSLSFDSRSAFRDYRRVSYRQSLHLLPCL